MRRVVPYVDTLLGVSNLDANQAKTLAYYCIMTWSDMPKIRPIIDLNGESGTGKSGIMRQLMPWCRNHKWINARNVTPATLRDELADTCSALIEEADKTKDPKDSENWYQYRYDEGGLGIYYRRQLLDAKGKQVYSPERHNHFGYTILHTQAPFSSPEMDRRTLRLIVLKDLSRAYKAADGLESAPLAEIAGQVDWTGEVGGALSNSAWDVWLPLLRVAKYLNDGEFIEYAREQVTKKLEEDNLTKVYEAKGLVLGEIAETYESSLVTAGKSSIPVTDIRRSLNERGYLFNERQIVKLAKDLGFTIAYPHNKAFVKVISAEELRVIEGKVGVKGSVDAEVQLAQKPAALSFGRN